MDGGKMPQFAAAKPGTRLREFVEIELKHVSLSRNDRPVLRDVSWKIRAGERWVLFGDNGAGKTQLLKLLAGDVWPTPDGRERRRYRWRGERFDEPYGVKQEIAYVGAERQDKYERYGWDFTVSEVVGTGVHRTDIPLYPLTVAQQRSVAKLLERFGVAALASRKFLKLSYGQRRLVLLARAVATRPGLMLLDELFEGLDHDRHALVSRWLQSTARSGIPWVLATHRMQDVPTTATHIATLSGGGLRARSAGNARTVRQAPDGTGRESIRGGLRKKRPCFLRSHPVPHAPAAIVRNGRLPLLVQLSRATVYLGESPVVRNVSMEVRAGDCWVVHGANGSGKTTLLRTIYGDHGVGRKAIWRFGIEPGVPIEEFKQRVGWVAPNLQSDHPLTLKVSEVMESGRYASVGLNGPASRAVRLAARNTLRRFGLAALEQRTLRELSYGQARRILFARAFVSKPGLLLLDEPFAGVDRLTRLELRKIVDGAIAKGIAVVLSTHHRDEWPAGATHELELREGRAIYCGEIRERPAQKKTGRKP